MKFKTAWITVATTILLTSLGGNAARADAGDCNGVRDIGPGTAISLGAVKSSERRVHFLKSASAQQSCPSNSPKCREKDSVSPGDQIIVSAVEGEFLCADHINARGLRRTGWLPRNAVVLLPSRTPPRSDGWIGRWTSGPEQTISITRTPRAGEIRIRGEASFGALEPSRQDREGLVSTGELEGHVRPTSGFAAFTMGTNATLPYDQGEEVDCRVRMQRLGSFLLVEDNRRCGGINVSFSGIYRRSGRRP
jgi:hypothetical protein